MSTRLRFTTPLLKWIAIIAPIGFWLFVLILRSELFHENRTVEGDIFALVVLGIGALIFSTWVFRIIEQREAQVRQRSEQLAALHDAALALTTELDLGTVLQKVVDLSRGLTGAKYGALGVLDDSGKYIEQFITSGITPEQRARLGDPPRGHGLLGALIKERTPIRIPEIARDPRSVGFPPNHPPMHSLLGVPIKSKGHVFGDLYLTDQVNTSGDDGAPYTLFTEQDQELLEMFATQAAIAIENAQLYRQTQELVVLKERERFGMDLHDGIIQSIYAIGLTLEDSEQRIEEEPEEAKGEITRAIHSLNDVIRDIRNYILDLRPERFQGRDLKRGLEELAREFRANTFLNVNVHADDVDTSLSPEQTVEILHIAQEALTNVRKHGRATDVNLGLTRSEKQLVLMIQDNGVGFDAAAASGFGGHGLGNMRERALALGGEIDFERSENGGTRVELRLPDGTIAASKP